MSAGFGFSVGDFLAALKLVGTVIDALREASESGGAYRELLNELYTLESALLRVKRLELDQRQRGQETALRQAAAQCQRTIDEFLNKVRHYQPHLRDGGSGSHVKDCWVKVKWAVCKKSDMDKFKADIQGHIGSINVLLLAVQMEATELEAKKQDKRHMTLAGKIQTFSSQWLSHIHAISNGVTQSVRQGKALLESTAKIAQTNLRIFQMVFDIHQTLVRMPAQVNRQQPVYMIDALGKESPFHLEFVRSAEALVSILTVNFESTGCGPRMIRNGEFVIQDDGTKRDIDLTSNWDTCFFPGQRVSMSMVMSMETDAPPPNTCPACWHETRSSAGEEALWYVDDMQIHFQRVQDHSLQQRKLSRYLSAHDGRDRNHATTTSSVGRIGKSELPEAAVIAASAVSVETQKGVERG